MSLLGDRSASFIIRIWRDDREDTEAEVVWRGSIESVRNGDKVHFRELAMIETFLKHQLRDIGIDLSQRQPGSRDETLAPERDAAQATHDPKNKPDY
jgi:hypothetical protein